MTESPPIPRQSRGGLLLKALFVLGLLLVASVGAWVVLLPSIVAATIHSKTGFIVKIDRLSANPLTANFRVSGLVVQNPEGWPEADFFEVRQFKADVQLWPLLTGRFVANDVVADIAQVTLVKNQQGLLNAAAFSKGFGGSGSGQTGSGPAAPAVPANTRGGRGFLIHHLSLKFDKLVYADYSRGKPLVKTYDVNLDREMTEVDSVAKIISPLTGNALGALANAFGGVNPKDAGLLTDAVESLQSAGKKAGETLKNLFHSLDNKKP